MVEDLTAFFADFGETATFGGGSVTVLFDKAFALGGGLVEGSNPIVTALAVDMPTVSQDDSIIVRGVTYTIASVQYDVTGTLLTLELEAT